jgi:hypothetical protein
MKKITRNDLKGLTERFPIFNQEALQKVRGGYTADEIQDYLTSQLGNSGSGSYDANGNYYWSSGGYDVTGFDEWTANAWYGDSWSYGGGNLTDAEKQFIMNHPYAASKFSSNAQKATNAAASFSGQHNGDGDAIRHAYWSALNAKDEGRALAEAYGNAHEANPAQPIGEKQMDLHNNSVGYTIGEQARVSGASDEDIFHDVMQAYYNGELCTTPGAY